MGTHGRSPGRLPFAMGRHQNDRLVLSMARSGGAGRWGRGPIAGLFLALGLSACLPQSRPVDNDSADGRGAHAASDEDGGNAVLEPVAGTLMPLGLAFRAEVTFGAGEDAILTEGYGINALPTLMDVDGDRSTGLLGQDISVRMFALLNVIRLVVTRLDGAPSALPIRVEAVVMDPLDVLGLQGSDLRIYLGYDARRATAPERFEESLITFTNVIPGYPRVTTGQFEIAVDGPGESLQALAGAFEKSGDRVRANALNIGLDFLPVPAAATVDVTLATDAEETHVGVSVTSSSRVRVSADSIDGAVKNPAQSRRIEVEFDQLADHVALDLTGADDFTLLEGKDNRISYTSGSPIDALAVCLREMQGGVLESQVDGRVSGVPIGWEILQSADGVISIDAVDRMGLVEVGIASGGPALYWPGEAPGTPFVQHYLYQVESGAGAESMTLRVKDLHAVRVDAGRDLLLDARMARAPLQILSRDADRSVAVRLRDMPAELHLQLPEVEGHTQFRYRASEPAASLEVEIQDPDRRIAGRIVPLPASISLCIASDGACGSSGPSTDFSIALSASEPMVINYLESGPSDDEIQLDNVAVTDLFVDGGGRSGFKEGYLFFDTNSHEFSGYIQDRSGSGGVRLELNPGTHAEDRSLTWKTYINFGNKRGTMHCTGDADLFIRSGGRWYDADFVIDELC